MDTRHDTFLQLAVACWAMGDGQGRHQHMRRGRAEAILDRRDNGSSRRLPFRKSQPAQHGHEPPLLLLVRQGLWPVSPDLCETPFVWNYRCHWLSIAMPSRCRPAVARRGLATQAAGAAQQEQSQKLQNDYRCQEAPM